MACGGACISQVGGNPGGVASTVELQGLAAPTVVAVTATGSTDDLVLLFTGANTLFGTVPLTSWMTRTDSATLGTVFTPLQSGIYACTIYVPWAAGVNAALAITKNATVAQRQTANPEPLDPEVFNARLQFGDEVNGTGVPIEIPVTRAEIAAGTADIRAHAFDPSVAGTPPAAASFVNVAEVVFRIFRVGDING